MRGHAASILFVVLCLTGCSSHVPPPSYTDEQLVAHYTARMEAAWVNTGLEGQVDRPRPPMSLDQQVNAESLDPFSACVVDLGLNGWGMGDESGGPAFTSSSGEELPPEVELGVFACFAEYPAAAEPSRFLLTDAQQDYLYDYYQQWVIPCLESKGYAVDFFPDRSRFTDSGGGWIPYFMVNADGLEASDYERMVAQCGDPFADLDVEDPRWF